MNRLVIAAALLAATAAAPAPAAAQAWQPSKPVEFVVTSSPGGGTDNFTRMIQSIILKYKLIDQPIVVTNKGGGSGAEGYLVARTSPGDPHKVIFGTNNAYLLPYVAKLGYKFADLTPVAALALDEFLLWVKADAPWNSAKDYIDAVKAKPEEFKMAGSQSKDTDQTLTSILSSVTGAKFLYVPFQGGAAAGTQLAGGHVHSNTNNPNESIGQWKAGQVRPLCVFSPKRLPAGAKVTETQGWADIPTCKESGVPVERFQMPRTVWLPAGAPAEAAKFYEGVLRKVSETPEWQEYITRTVQTGQFLAGAELKAFVEGDEKASREVFEREGWIAK
ncbi:MAG: tripartite tricarboxylate transporter substrate binding protein [Methylobacteriaceae bacterium]|nr:tripartite tricarboxylate transporter substrate binding protein [Methylobacteriaceae bacterium]